MSGWCKGHVGLRQDAVTVLADIYDVKARLGNLEDTLHDLLHRQISSVGGIPNKIAAAASKTTAAGGGGGAGGGREKRSRIANGGSV